MKNIFLQLLLMIFIITNSFSQISGTVFRDYNANGTKDTNEPLVTGMTINAYSATGTLCGTTTTTATAIPNYSLTGCGTGAVRIEFVIPPTGNCLNSSIDFSALGGATYGSSVQFVNGNSTNINFALNNPVDYNTGVANTNVFVPCYVNGDPLPSGSASGSMDWFVGFPITNAGETTPPTQKLNGATIGATWGVAYSKQANKIFTSAFIKRHVGLGTLGSGGIYILTPTATSFTATAFFDMDNNSFNTAASPVTRTRADATAPAYGNASSYQLTGDNIIDFIGTVDALSGSPSGLGVVGTNAQRGHTSDPMQVSYDPSGFDQVGKVGLGSIEISDDGKYIFVVNLYSKKVFRLTLDNAFNPTVVTAVTSYDIPTTTCTNGSFRPFGTKLYRNILYVGGVCTGESSGQNIVGGATDLYAYVYALNSPTGSATFNSTPVITYPLNYLKGATKEGGTSIDRNDLWHPWNNNSDVLHGDSYPQPMLTDIDFTENGDMMMDFTDRGGHQWGSENFMHLQNSNRLTGYNIGGELLIAGKNCATNNFILENNSSYTSGNSQTYTATTPNNNEGPGNGEFFTGDEFRIHHEASMGSLAVLPGTNEAYVTVMDPTNFDTGGTRRFSSVTGAEVPAAWSGYKLYGKIPFFGKANGLGDVELSGIISPIEIGNRVWTDTDNDGIQDADELGISGITVTLCLASAPTTAVATATTDANGNYYFSSVAGTSTASAIYGLNLTFNTNYILKFPTTSGANTISTKPNTGTNDLIDTDADATGKITFTTGTAGQNNHSFDVGYSITSAACAINATITQGACNNNSTNPLTTDDYYTLNVNASATNGSASFEVLLNGNILNTGGTNYGTSLIVGTNKEFKADGTTIYTLTIRDKTTTSCSISKTTTPVASCSNCPTQLCPIVTLQKMP